MKPPGGFTIPVLILLIGLFLGPALGVVTGIAVYETQALLELSRVPSALSRMSAAAPSKFYLYLFRLIIAPVIFATVIAAVLNVFISHSLWRLVAGFCCAWLGTLLVWKSALPGVRVTMFWTLFASVTGGGAGLLSVALALGIYAALPRRWKPQPMEQGR
ncbi:hypothetical protein WDZ92_41405 [Nostoc sp. NIES-2111]